MIEAEIVSTSERSGIEKTADRARQVADAFARLGAEGMATRARATAEVLERAQATVDAARPAVGALSSLVEALERSGILRYQERTALGKKL